MKILVISVFPPAEVPEADHAYHQCLSLAEAGHEIQVLSQKGSIAPVHPRLQIQAVMETWNWQEVFHVIRVLRQRRPDAILLNYVGHAYRHHPMITYVATLTRLFFPKIAFVTQVTHPSGAENIQPRRRVLLSLISRFLGQKRPSPFGTLLRDSSGIVVLSRSHLNILEQQEPQIADKAVLIPPPVIMPLAPEDSRAAKREKLGIAPQQILLTFFGYIYRGKGIETLLRAYSALCCHRSDVSLMLVGGGAVVAPGSQDPYVAELRQLLQELKIEKKVIFTGGFSWDSDEASRYLWAADIAVLPFDKGVLLNNSSFAGVVTHGLPTITTQGELLEAPLEHRQNVFLCPPQDPEALAAALETVMEEAELRNTLHLGALELAHGCFSWDSATQRLLSILSSTAPAAASANCFS